MNGLINKFIALSLAIAMQLPTATLALAQSSPDIRSPVIELDVIAESSADNTQVFSARVSDDILIKDVLLYHRRAGRQPFKSVAMLQAPDNDSYVASLNTDPTDLRAIEYYIQARDEGGNRSIEGFAFDPYIRVLTANDTVINTAVAPTSASTEPVAENVKSKVRWWHIVAGVVVVGAVASLAISDSGEESQTNDTTGTVPLTVNLTGP